MDRDLETIASLLRTHACGKLLLVTGASISLASGIPTFRDRNPGAIWQQDVTELGTFRYLCQDPVGSWRWYLSRIQQTAGAQPNPAHTALVSLEADGVYAPDSGSKGQMFHPAPAPSQTHVEQLVERASRRILRFFWRRSPRTAA